MTKTATQYPHSMTATQAARAFGVSRQALSKWPCPRNADGTFNLPRVIAWRMEQVREGVLLEYGIDADLVGGKGSPELERYRKERADEVALKNAEWRRELVPMDELREVWSRAAEVLKRGGMVLERRCGVEARTIFEQHLDDAMAAVAMDGETTQDNEGSKP